jgi:NADH-quinone oxidoreductase subunit H
LAFLIFLVRGCGERGASVRLPEGESELISGYFTEYSGLKYLMFFMTDFIEIGVVAGLVTTFFFGGWQLPYLMNDGFHFPWGAQLLLPQVLVALLQVGAFLIKVLFFCWVQVLIRWSCRGCDTIS